MDVRMYKFKSEKYIHRNIWITRCNDNYISNIIPLYNLHLKSIADEINVVGAAAFSNPPKTSMEQSWKKIKTK
jgi:hypothetical protein